MNATEAMVRRLPPDRAPGPTTLTLLDTAHGFRAGSRIRLIVAGGSFPQYARNLGTGENPVTGATLRAARREIALGPSRLALPCA